MNTTFSDRSLGEATESLKVLESYQATKGEKLLKSFGDNVNKVAGSDAAGVLQSETAGLVLAVVKDQVNHFVENSKILVGALEEIGKAHPFIQIAVSIFKVAIHLEITHQENDGKVVALKGTMSDMMATLRLLNKIVSPKDKGSDGFTIEDRMLRRMGGIVDSIKSCSQLCHSYLERHTAVKYFTSFKWKNRFADVAQEFISHKEGIHHDLQIHISSEITEANATLKIVNQNVSLMMSVVFEHMCTAEELDIASFVEEHKGIEAVVGNEQLLKQLMEKQQKRTERSGDKSDKAQPLSLQDLQKELAKGVDEVLAENSKIFERNFAGLEISLKDVKVTIHREGDRVIAEILANISAGPHERIIDRDLYEIWKYMGWKGSVKATHLVMAVHDHFFHKANSALSKIRVIASGSDPSNPAEKVQNTAYIGNADPATPEEEDLWALEYITIHRVQPLMEALDADGSSFVTVDELNAFSTSRPEGWSLPRWIAYHTYGFEMTCHWYHLRIRSTLLDLANLRLKILPSNRTFVSGFMQYGTMEWLEDILSGLRDVGDGLLVDSWDDSVFLKFKEWVLFYEHRYLAVLEKMLYCIDDANFSIVTLEGRPGSYFLPIMLLLLRRSLWVVQKAQDVNLHREELATLQRSMYTVLAAASNHVTKLQSIYSFQNLDPKEKIKKVFFGLWSYVNEEPIEKIFNSEDPSQNSIEYWSSLIGFIDEPEVKQPDLFHGAVEGGLDEADSVVGKTAHSYLKGYWSGSITSDSSAPSSGLFSVEMSSEGPGGTLQGIGIGPNGCFRIKGQQRLGISFVMESFGWGESGPSEFKGELIDDDGGIISGVCGPYMGKLGVTEVVTQDPSQLLGGELAESIPAIQLNLADLKGDISEARGVVGASAEMTPGGTFVLHRRPADYYLLRPSDEALTPLTSNSQKLWQVVRNASRYWYRQRHLSWTTIKERKEKREEIKKLLSTYNDLDSLAFGPTGVKRLELLRSVHPDDLRSWKAIFEHKSRCEIAHLTVACSSCGAQLSNSRLYCVACSDGEPRTKTLDLCKSCISETVYRKDGDKHHDTSHMLLQLRCIIFHADLQNIIQDLPRLLEYAPETPVECNDCRKEIPARPFWHCLTCQGEAAICIECNLRDEERRPWCLQRRPPPQAVHNPLHIMALITDGSDLKPSERSGVQTTDQRLARLEANVKGFEDSVTARLDRLEGTIERLIAALGKIS